MARDSITATELTFAVLEPDWRARWLRGEKPSTKSFAPVGTPRAMGVQFHKEVEKLVGWLTARESFQAAAQIDSAAALLDHLWATSLQALTDKLFEAGRAEDAAQFTERMRNFCIRLIELRRRTARFENWQDIFVCAEQDLPRIPVPLGDTVVEVRGRVDAIRIHPERHLEVVDYKLSQGARQKADLVQLAIYAHLLPIWRPGCEFCGTLEYYSPEFQEVAVGQADLKDIFTGMVSPVLREMFAAQTEPKTEKLGAPRPAKPAIAKLAESSRATAGTDLTALGQAVVEAFRGFNLTVEAASVSEGPQLVRLRLTPGPV
jgi:RecB family exonuclease